MTLDKDTLTRAEQARDHLLELQHSAEVARVDYHHTIRKLHVKGGSLREIAEALGLSHQRVHQIVEPVDGASPSDRGPEHKVHRRLRGFVPFERFAQEARTAVGAAIDQAAALGHRRVGTEHLLISLTSADTAPAGAALASLGVPPAAVAAAVRERLGSGPAGSIGRRPFTPAARRYSHARSRRPKTLATVRSRASTSCWGSSGTAVTPPRSSRNSVHQPTG